MNEKVTAIIPAKGMSNRLLSENTLESGGSNLLVHRIRQLKQVDVTTEVIVSSEDDDTLTMADKEGARAAKHPYEYSAETLPSQDFLHYITGEAKEDRVMWACCTSSMVGADVYRKGCKTRSEKLKEGYDSLITVIEYHHYLLDRDMKPYAFKWEPEYRDSQDLDKLYFFTDGIQLVPKASTREWYYYLGHNPYGMEVDLKTPTDIGTIFDYLLTRMQYRMDDDVMMARGINSKDGEAVYHYVLGKMISQLNDEELAKAPMEMPDGKRANVLGLIK